MSALVKLPCRRCAGSGNFSFNLKDGTRCYGCNGTGHVLGDPVRIAKSKANREKRATQRLAERDSRIAAGNKLIADREAKYAGDPRIGPTMKIRCSEFLAVAQEVYKALALADSGANIHPSVITRLSD